MYFLREHESAIGNSSLLPKLHVWQKSGSWVMVQEPLDQLKCRNWLRYEIVFFFHMVGGLQNFKFVQSFQLGVVRHAQSYWKQISFISKVNSGMNLICLWLGIHKYILRDLVHVVVVRRTRAWQKKIIQY